MVNTIILIDNPTDTELLHKKIASDAQVFSFNFYTHKSLEKEKIEHKIAEEYLDVNERLRIFDLAVSYYNWYDTKKLSEQFTLEGINLLGILDTAELHMLFIHQIKNLLITKTIIEKERPKKIIFTSSLENIVKSLAQTIKLDLEVLEDTSKYYLEWDRIELKFNAFGKPMTLRLSRENYNKIKSLLETIVCKFFGFWFKPNDKNKTILFLENNPSSYEDLFKNLSKYNHNIVFFNRRRPAIWNLKSISILQKYNCKIFNFKKIESAESDNINNLTNHYLTKLKQIWPQDDLFDMFSIDGVSIWPAIKNTLFQTYQNRLKEYISLVLVSKKLFQNVNPSAIVCLNIFGETEKTILNSNSKLIPSVLLEHGYANYTPEIERYDVLSMYSLFKDKIAVWGDTQKQYLIEHKKIDPQRIIVCGSPRHDSFFTQKCGDVTDDVVLLTIHSINEISAKTDTNIYIKFECLLKTICMILKKYDKKIIVKLHPGQDIHNETIKKLLAETDPSIPIYQLKPIKELLSMCSALINISPEGFDPSTVLLEGLILNKPTMNIVIDELFYDFQYEKDEAILSVSPNDDLEKQLYDILFNKDFRQKLVTNGKKHIETYLSNHGTASECIAKTLVSL